MLACAALQNMVSEPGWARLVVEQGYTDHLERLADADNPMVVRYASGALKNVIVTLRNAGDDYSASQDSLDAVARRTLQTKLEVFAYNRAARLLAKAVRDIPSEVRPPPRLVLSFFMACSVHARVLHLSVRPGRHSP